MWGKRKERRNSLLFPIIHFIEKKTDDTDLTSRSQNQREQRGPGCTDEREADSIDKETD